METHSSSSTTNHDVFLALGSNLGNTEANLKRAIKLINKRIGPVISQSSFYSTLPWGFYSRNAFLNAVVKLNTILTPRQLLEATQKIEQQMGRREKTVNGQYHDRTIDIDILLYDDLNIDEPDLKIPHPLMHERAFVMNPLNEILEKES